MHEASIFINAFVVDKIVATSFRDTLFFFGVHPTRMTTTSSSTLKESMKRKNPCAKEARVRRGCTVLCSLT